MSTFNGLPVHALLVHFIVVLAPLTAVLAVLCVVWRAAQQRLVWLVLALAVVTAGLTPLTTDSGEWLEHHVDKSPLVHEHAELGDTMAYFAVALLIAAILLAVQYVRANRGKSFSTALSAAIAVFVVVASVATTVQVFRIGHTGAESVWKNKTLTSSPAGDSDEK